MKDIRHLDGWTGRMLRSVTSFVCLLIFIQGCGENSSRTTEEVPEGRGAEVSLSETVQGAGALTRTVEPGEVGSDSGKETVSPGLIRDPFIHLANREVDTRTAPSLLRDVRHSGKGIYLIHFKGPIRARWVEQMKSSGLLILDYLPMDSYAVHGDLATVRELASGIEELDWVGEWTLRDKVSPRFPTSGAQVEATFFIANHPAARSSIDLVAAAGSGDLMPDHDFRNNHILARTLDRARLQELITRDDVYWVEPWVEPIPCDEVQDQIMAGNRDDLSPTGPGYLEWLGNQPVGMQSDVLVDICDTGLDTGDVGGPHHPDFGTRITYQNNFVTGESNGDDPSGHGTINASIVGGDGTTGTGLLDPNGYYYGLGIAPQVRLGGTAVFNNSGRWGVSGTNLHQFVAAAYDAGARITTNSWGAAISGAYDYRAQEYDAAVRDSDIDPSNGTQPMITFFSAGNSGSGNNSIGSPGTAKNLITVGASENYRMNGTDGCSVGDDRADNLKDLVNFSSRGPTNDGRLKPDLVAPGTHVQGAASTHSGYTGTSVCDEYWPTNQSWYARSSGTSHSTPAVAGVGALVFSWYKNLTDLEPSPALTKAILTSHTWDMVGGSDGSNGQLENLPNNKQGWGLMDMSNLFDPNVERYFFDQEHVFTESGQVWLLEDLNTYDISKPLKVSLVWTDAPGATSGASYVNDLNLEVLVDGRVYMGNVFLEGWSQADAGEFDQKNNIENVFLPAGMAERITIRVTAANLTGDGVPAAGGETDQDFAIYVYNAALQSPKGRIFFNSSTFGLNSDVQVTVSDEDLKGENLIYVEVWSDLETAPETIALLEIGPDKGVFRGHFPLTPDPAVVGDHRLQVADGVKIHARYLDQDDGTGNPAEATTSAVVDGQAPKVIRLDYSAFQDQVIISWTTDEPAHSLVEIWELGGPVVQSLTLQTDLLTHSATLDGLNSCTEYGFRIWNSDRYGNGATEDNLGNGFSFTTKEETILYETTFDSDPGWEIDGDWSFGAPAGLCGDPESAFSGENVYGNDIDRDGCYGNNAADKLYSPWFGINSNSYLSLRFRRWLLLETGYDEAGVKLEVEGNGWQQVFSTKQAADTAWVHQVVDIGQVQGDQARLQWYLNSDSSITRGGWSIDDVLVSSVQACPGENARPSCNLMAIPNSGLQPLEVTLVGQGSADPDGSIARWIWDLGDGTHLDGTDQLLVHTFENFGYYDVVLTLVDNQGAVSSCTTMVDVNVAPEACFISDFILIQENETVSFDASCSRDKHGHIVKWEWDFGDGAHGSGKTPKHNYGVPGTYDIYLTVTDDAGEQDTAGPLSIIVNDAPVADFLWNPEFPLMNEQVAFDPGISTDSDGEVMAWEWDFGDGQVLQEEEKPVHVFPSPGTYTVTMKIADNWGGKDEIIKQVKVNGPPTAVMAISPETPLEQGQPFTFDGSGSYDWDGHVVGWRWNFSDGITLGQETVEHSYLCPGLYSVYLTVTDDSGARNMTSGEVMVLNSPPTVNAGEDVVLKEGSVRLFSGSGSDLCPSTPLSWTWNFGDGTYGLTPTAPHSWPDDGIHTVTLCLADNMNGVGCDELTVTVENVAPVVDAGGDRVGAQGQALTLYGSFADPGADTHTIAWDFGDGGSASDSLSPSHIYQEAGEYLVTLTVVDDDGGQGQDSVTVIIGNEAPLVDAGPNQNVSEGALVQFHGAASDPGAGELSLVWSFGDGAQATGTLTPTHVYLDDGIYTVTLTVTDEAGSGLTASDTLTVTVRNEPPVVDAGEDQTGLEGQSFQFQAQVTEAGDDQYTSLWDFGDGTTSSQAAPNHVFKDNGEFTVTLLVTDEDGAVAADTLVVKVENVEPVVDAGEDLDGLENEQLQFHGTVTDPGSLDYHTYHWDFGDGDTEDGTLTPSHAYETEGTYVVTLTVMDQDGGVGEDELEVVIGNTPPQADAGPDRSGNEGQAVALMGSGTDQGGIQSWRWDFGDGEGTDAGPGVTHIYADDGLYIATLTVTDEGGLSDSDYLLVSIKNLPPAIAPLPPMSVLEGHVLEISPSVTDPGALDNHSYLWSFGDGGMAMAEVGSHAYADNGQYLVTLKVTDNGGAASTASFQVVVENAPPVVDAGEPISADPMEQVHFYGSFSDPGQGDTHLISWDFADGTTLQGTLSPTHSFQTAGTYLVTLTVTDDDGGSAQDTVIVTVGDLAPEVEAGPDRNVAEGQPIHFSGQAEDLGGGQLTFHWTFGDGSGADGASVDHVYQDNGVFTVMLQVTDGSGLMGADSLNVVVSNVAPIVDAGQAKVVNEGSPVALVGTWSDPGAGDTHTLRWDFGDGQVSTGTAELGHTYADDGVYSACFRVTDDDAGAAEDCVTVTVKNLAPHFESEPVLEAVEGEAWTYQALALDPAGDEDPVIFSLDVSPEGMSMQPQSGVLSWTPGRDDVCVPVQVVIRAQDDDGGVSFQTFQVVVENRSDAPTIISTPPTSGVQGFPYTYYAQASDLDLESGCLGEFFTWVLAEAPAGMTVSQTGVVTWTPDNTSVGIHHVVLQVEDMDGLVAEQSYDLSITPDPQAPVAIAGPDRELNPGVVVLDGSNSFPSATIMTWNWGYLDGPVPLELTGCEPQEPVCELVLTRPGTYTFTLTVVDSAGHISPEDQVALTIRNLAPIAHPGYHQVVELGSTVVLDGSLSSDINDDPLTFSWELEGPVEAVLQDGDTSTPGFLASEVGQYLVRLRVGDGQSLSQVREVYITAVDSQTPEHPPVALPSPQLQEVLVGQSAALTAASSHDPEGDTLEFSWSQVQGPAPLELPSNPQGSLLLNFTAPGVYRFALVASDGGSSSLPAYASVIVHPAESLLPLAEAGQDLVVEILKASTLQGILPGDEQLQFFWRQLEGPGLVLENTLAPSSAIRPIRVGTRLLGARAATPAGLEGPEDIVRIFCVSPGNHPPVAEVGDDLFLPAPQEVQLKSLAYDPDGDALAGNWVQVGGPSVPLVAQGLDAGFLPCGFGRYVFEHRVWDSEVISAPARIEVLVADQENQVPVADAGADFTALVQEEARLDGSASYDPEQVALSWDWSQVSGPAVELVDVDGPSPGFVPQEEGEYVFQLRVMDDFFLSEPDQVVVSVVTQLPVDTVEALPEQSPETPETDILTQPDTWTDAGEQDVGVVGDGTSGDLNAADEQFIPQIDPSGSGCGCRLDGPGGTSPMGSGTLLLLGAGLFLVLRSRRKSA